MSEEKTTLPFLTKIKTGGAMSGGVTTLTGLVYALSTQDWRTALIIFLTGYGATLVNILVAWAKTDPT